MRWTKYEFQEDNYLFKPYYLFDMSLEINLQNAQSTSLHVFGCS